MYKCTICHILRDLTFFTFKLDRILKMIAGFKKKQKLDQKSSKY